MALHTEDKRNAGRRSDAGNDVARKRYYIAPEERDPSRKKRKKEGLSPALSANRRNAQKKRDRYTSEARDAEYENTRRRRAVAERAPRGKIRIQNPGRLFCCAAILLIVLVVGGIFLHTKSVLDEGRDTFYSGVSVNGIDLAGMTLEEGLQTVRSYTDEWLSRTYVFTWQDRQWSFCAKDIDASVDTDPKVALAYNLGHVGSFFERKKDVESLKDEPVSFIATLEYNDEKLDEFISGIAAEIDVDPVEAKIVVDVANPVVVSGSSEGRALNREQLKETILSLLDTGEGSTELPVEIAYPALSTADAYACTELLITYQTDTTFRNMDSCSNVRTALNNFNGFCLAPGEKFSFNDVVGDRTRANGYVEATEYAGANTTTGIGGGVCQASTTLYGALLKAGMTQLIRSNHTMVVSYVKPGIDAAVSYGTKDLVMQNNTPYPIYVYTNVSKGFATVKVYGHKTEYEIDFDTEILETIYPEDRYVKDTTGEYVYYDTEWVLKTEGVNGCRCTSYLVYKDWETGEEVKREQLNMDYYYPLNNEYYVGVHSAGESTTGSTNP